MSKRGFALSFYWIFAIIAGFIVFMFLINFAYNHIYLSEKTTSSSILLNLENQIDSLSIAENLDTVINLGKELTLTFDCGSISLDDLKVSTEKIIFSNKVIKSNELLIWTKSWKYPFAIANFYYIMPKSQKFYFFDAPFDLLSNIPESFQIYSYPDEVPKDSILVFFRQPTQQELIDYKSHKIKIIQDNTVTFYPDSILTYYGDEMLLGAIFTDDFNKVKCLNNKALERLNVVSYVYQKKAETLANVGCIEKYNLMISALDNFKSNPVNPDIINNQDKELEKNDCTPLFH